MSKFQDLTGQRFGRLTVIERVKNNKFGTAQWYCKCDCGKYDIVSTGNLKKNTASCGCYRKERMTKHGKSNERIYKIWKDVIKRCNNSNHRFYNNYGGRGITVCDEWLHDFQAFYDWAMNNGYENSLTIDRIDNNKGYFPDNCRWVDYKIQANNRRSNHLITYNGKTQTMAQWADELGIKYKTLSDRINISKWSIEKAFNTPIKGGGQNKH